MLNDVLQDISRCAKEGKRPKPRRMCHLALITDIVLMSFTSPSLPPEAQLPVPMDSLPLPLICATAAVLLCMLISSFASLRMSQDRTVATQCKNNVTSPDSQLAMLTLSQSESCISRTPNMAPRKKPKTSTSPISASEATPNRPIHRPLQWKPQQRHLRLLHHPRHLPARETLRVYHYDIPFRPDPA